MDAADDSTKALELLAPDFLALSQIMQADRGQLNDLDRIVRMAKLSIPHATDCAITLIQGMGRPRTVASTGDLALRLDEIQYASGQGPCLDALAGDDVVVVPDLAVEERWPEFSKRSVAETPARSMTAVRLRLEGDARAAFNLCSIETGAFDELDVASASALAPFVALSIQSMLHERRANQLESALQTSRQIGTAMGILMSQELISSEQAFSLLREASQHLNRKLRDVAADVELTGTLPDYQRSSKLTDDAKHQ